MFGAILIGGQSTRMGEWTDKATLLLADGRTMVEHVAAALRALCDDIVFVGAYSPRLAGGGVGESQPARSSGGHPGQARGYLHVADLRPQAGPLGAIEALLASNLADEYLVCPCDVPRITPEVLRLLLAHREAPATVLCIRGREQFEPLPARIASSALPVVRRLLDAGQRSVWRLMEELPAAIVEIDECHAAALRNVNTHDDLKNLNTP
jgi:molybdopterin-guanine dinucleotide biosynthesis protein A